MEDKNKKILTIIWSLTLVITLIGTSFAYFIVSSNTKPQIIITKSLDLSLILQGSTNIDKINPTNWSTLMDDNDNNINIAKIPFAIKSSAQVDGTYTIRMTSNIKENDLLNGGSASDIKYKLYKDDKEVSSGNFNIGDVNLEIATGAILNNKDLDDEYILYVYIENRSESQNRLQNISFNITLHGEANLIG